MPTLSQIVKQLTAERARAQREVERFDQAIAALSSVTEGGAAPAPARKRTISAAGRRAIAAAQRARWAKQKGEVKVRKPRRKMSAAARARIGAARRAWWAKQKAQK